MFDRVISLIGNDKFVNLQNTKVLIVGCGGVGGYAFETLVRSGIGNIDLIDFDDIDVSNLNRQVITSQSNIGLSKVEEAKKRALLINPNLNINTYKMFLDDSNIDKILNNNYFFKTSSITNLAHNIPALAGTIIKLPNTSHLIATSSLETTYIFLFIFKSFIFFLKTFASGS